MPGKSPEEAVDAYVGRVRRTLACLTRASLLAGGITPGIGQASAFLPFGHGPRATAAVRTHGGNGELRLRLSLGYRVDAGIGGHRFYAARTVTYRYEILDRSEQEIVAFHWDPEGIGTVRTPHVHRVAAAPVVLPQRSGSSVAQANTYLSKLHLPTGPIAVEDVVELLIRDLAADPLRADWQHVLDANRQAAIEDA